MEVPYHSRKRTIVVWLDDPVNHCLNHVMNHWKDESQQVLREIIPVLGVLADQASLGGIRLAPRDMTGSSLQRSLR